MPHGPWYISARAVREYTRILGLGNPDDDHVFARAENDLIALAEDVVALGRPGRRLSSGAIVYRVRLPIPPGQPGERASGRLRRPGRGSTGRPRINLVVVETPRPEGPLPQLVRVTEETYR